MRLTYVMGGIDIGVTVSGVLPDAQALCIDAYEWTSIYQSFHICHAVIGITTSIGRFGFRRAKDGPVCEVRRGASCRHVG